MDEELLKRMQDLLYAAKKELKTTDPIQDVNLFSILGMENKEVSAHSAFLYYVFKPFQKADGSGVDDSHLRMLLEILFPDIKEKPAYVDIFREYATDLGRLDFLIIFDRNAAVIELKIWAGEQPEQISRYRAFMKKNGYSENNIYFLTPGRRESQTGESYNITLKDDIKPLLIEISKKRKQESFSYAAIIDQYIAVIDKITGGAFMLEGMELIKSPQDICAIDKLYDAKNQVLSNLIEEFLEQIAICLTEDGIWNEGNGYPVLTLNRNAEQLSKEHIGKFYKHGNSSYPALCFRVDDNSIKKLKPILRESLKKKTEPIDSSEEKDSEEQKLYFFVEIGSYPYAGFTPRSDDGKTLEKNAGGDIGALEKQFLKDCGAKYSNWFWEWDEIFDEKHSRISFTNYKNGVLQLLDPSRNDVMIFDQNKINAVVNDIKNIFKKQCKMFFNGIE